MNAALRLDYGVAPGWRVMKDVPLRGVLFDGFA